MEASDLISKESVEALLEGTTEGPWITMTGSFGRIDSIGPIEQGFSGEGLECDEADADLATSAPDLARTCLHLYGQVARLQAYARSLEDGYDNTRFIRDNAYLQSGDMGV